VKRIVSGLAVLYVALLVLGRSRLPMNAQWGDVLFPLLALAVWRAGPVSPWLGRQDWPLAVYLGVTLIAALASPGPAMGLQELFKQAYVASILLVFRQLGRDASLARRLQAAFVVSVAAMTAVSIAGVFVFAPGRAPLSTFGIAGPLPLFGVVARLRGLFEAPEMLGNALLIAFLFALALREATSGGSRWRWTAIATLLAAGEFLTFSHSVAGFAVAAVSFMLPWMSSRALRLLAWGTVVGVVITVNVASVVDPIPRDVPTAIDVRPVSIDLFGTRVEGQLMSYAALKEVAWSAFRENPLTGIGPGRFTIETRRAFREGRLARGQVGLVPHCAPAGRLAESGVLGALSLLILWASWFHGRGPALSAGTPCRRAALAAVIGLLVNSLNADVMNFRFLWLAVAWLSSPMESETA